MERERKTCNEDPAYDHNWKL